MAKNNDPVKILKQDHQRVRELLARAVETEGDSDVLAELVDEIEQHTELEEALVYPAFHEAAEGGEHDHLYYESLEEHALLDEVLAELDPESLEPPVLMAKIKVARDLFTHHAEEEEKQLFPLMKKLCSKKELGELGDQLQEARGASDEGARVDVNRASAEELKQIKGIDAVRADRIVKYRESHGPFHSWKDLAEIEGFDDGMIRTMRSQSSLGR